MSSKTLQSYYSRVKVESGRPFQQIRLKSSAPIFVIEISELHAIPKFKSGFFKFQSNHGAVVFGQCHEEAEKIKEKGEKEKRLVHRFLSRFCHSSQSKRLKHLTKS